jgi:TPR repeat protein
MHYVRRHNRLCSPLHLIKSPEHYKRLMTFEVGSDNEMFHCSLVPAISYLVTSKVVPRIDMTANGREAHSQLGVLYEKGHGVDKDKEKADEKSKGK